MTSAGAAITSIIETESGGGATTSWFLLPSRWSQQQGMAVHSGKKIQEGQTGFLGPVVESSWPKGGQGVRV